MQALYDFAGRYPIECLLVWAGVSVASVVVALRMGLLDYPALVLSMAAAVPGLVFLAEIGVRWLLPGENVPGYEYVTLMPVIVGVAITSFTLLTSFIITPPWRWSVRQEFLRLAHVAAWGMTTVATIFAVAGV